MTLVVHNGVSLGTLQSVPVTEIFRLNLRLCRNPDFFPCIWILHRFEKRSRCSISNYFADFEVNFKNDENFIILEPPKYGQNNKLTLYDIYKIFIFYFSYDFFGAKNLELKMPFLELKNILKSKVFGPKFTMTSLSKV
jgi:hypothetical protein